MNEIKQGKKVVMPYALPDTVLVDKKKHHQKRVAAYCRVSTDNDEQLTSYENQKKFYTEMIAKNKEWEMAGIYADEGISGTRADKRPAFNKMIKDCLAGKIDYVITKSVSRFARNIVDCMDYVRILKNHEIGIFFEEQNIDTLKTESELYLIIYAGFAQSESESISKNITWSYRKKFEEGSPVFVYHRLLGYRKGEDGQPEIVPEEAELVKRIFNLYLSGKTINEIRELMLQENIVIPGKKIGFSKSMITNLLRNEKYCGDCILQKTVTIDCISKTRKKNTGEAPMYIVENSHPAIISREMFNRTQEELSRRKVRAPQSQKKALTALGRYSKYALSDVLICGECGSRYRRVTWTSLGKKRIVWRCISRLDYGTKYCKNSPTIEENILHQAIVRAINKFHNEDATTYKMLMKATIGEALGINTGEDEVELLKKRVKALNDRMMEMLNTCAKEGATVQDYEEDFKSIADQIGQLNRRIDAIRENEHRDKNLRQRISKIQSMIDERDAHCDQYDDSIVRQMIECIKVFDDGRLEIIFGGGYEVEEYL